MPPHGRLYRHLLYFLLTLIASTAQLFALTDAWNVDANKHTAVQRTYKQGEYIDAYVTLRDGYAPLDLTGATAQFLWYTNSTDNLWWTNSAAITSPASGEIQFSWKPSMDTGAPINYYWVGIWMPGSTNPIWRINGTIRLLDSPGFAPNALSLPVNYLDFDAIEYTNGPWATPADVSTAIDDYSSYVQSQLNNASNYTAALIDDVHTFAETNLTEKLWSSTTNYVDGDGVFYELSGQLLAQYTIVVPTSLSVETNVFPNIVGESWTFYETATNNLSPYDWSRVRYTDMYSCDSGNFNDLMFVFNTYDDTEYWTIIYLIPQGPYSSTSYPATDSASNKDAESLTLTSFIGTTYFERGIVASSNLIANAINKFVKTNELADAINAHTVNFQDCLLYTSSGTNYYFRWSTTNNTYIVTGVPQ